jgi:hypothetical protein
MRASCSILNNKLEEIVLITCRDIPLGIPLLIRRTVNVKAMVKPWKAQRLDYGIKESHWFK